MNPISTFGAWNPVGRSGTTTSMSSREQELTRQLSDRLSTRLSHIRQQITTPSSMESIGTILDIQA
jgi:hypothetical protein